MPSASSRAANASTLSGAIVGQRTTQVPGAARAATPSLPNSTASVCAASTTATITTALRRGERRRRRAGLRTGAPRERFAVGANVADATARPRLAQALGHRQAHVADADDARAAGLHAPNCDDAPPRHGCSAARMVQRVQLLQPLARHVGVDRRRRDVGVAEQHLHRAQVGAVVEQVRREGVAQRVRRERRGDAGLSACALSSFQNICRVIGPPRPVTKSASLVRRPRIAGRASAT